MQIFNDGYSNLWKCIVFNKHGVPKNPKTIEITYC
jgi:hypothetical protein